MICSQTMGAMMSNDPTKSVKITICPPAEQDVFFQENQFDEEIGRGTDPIAYVRGSVPDYKPPLPIDAKRGLKAKKEKLDKAERSLEGHDNKKQIMKILRSGL